MKPSILVLVFCLISSQASACYHFKVWRYPYPQRCNYNLPAPTVAPAVSPSKLPYIDMSDSKPYYRSWGIWKAEQIEIPDILK